MNNYVAGFYDNAIKNIIDLAFIREHFSFLQEIYSEDGTTLVGFISVIPTNTALNSVLLYHDITGKPIYYNNVNGADLFSFDENGIMNKFFENVTINGIKIQTECELHESLHSIILLRAYELSLQAYATSRGMLPKQPEQKEQK